MRYAICVKATLAAIICIGLARQQIFAAKCPCDIYDAAGTPCVAAHSTVRALYASYNGPLYQVRRTADSKTLDIGVLNPGGIANAAAQDTFLNGKAGTISIIYDQSPQGNHLPVSPKAYWLPNGGKEANATAGKIKVNGHTVYGVYVIDEQAIAYRNNNTKGVARDNQAEAMYMVLDAKRFTNKCCFDYGNAETDGLAGAHGTMEAIYFGSDVMWGGTGGGNGPWVAADFEDGMFKSNTKNGSPTNTSITGMNYATTMLKGPSENRFVLKAGNAESGKLDTKWDGTRPTPSYYPKKLEGAIILGCGGDGSPGGAGTFFEGAMTIGNPPDAIDDSIQANIVAAGYGRITTAVLYGHREVVCPFMLWINYVPANGNAVISYALQKAGRVSMNIIDQQGRRIAAMASGIKSPGRHQAVWDAKRISAGVYFCRIAVDNKDGGTGKIIISK